jgi:hypothetical protein
MNPFHLKMLPACCWRHGQRLQTSSKVGLELFGGRSWYKLGPLNISISYIRKVCSHGHTYIVISRTKLALSSIGPMFSELIIIVGRRLIHLIDSSTPSIIFFSFFDIAGTKPSSPNFNKRNLQAVLVSVRTYVLLFENLSPALLMILSIHLLVFFLSFTGCHNNKKDSELRRKWYIWHKISSAPQSTYT